MVFNVLSRGIYLSLNPCWEVNFWKLTTKNWTDLSCLYQHFYCSGAETSWESNKRLLFLIPLEIDFTSQLANIVVRNSMWGIFYERVHFSCIAYLNQTCYQLKKSLLKQFYILTVKTSSFLDSANRTVHQWKKCFKVSAQ